MPTEAARLARKAERKKALIEEYGPIKGRLEQVLDVKVKALLMLAVVIGVIVGAFQYQLNQQANTRITQACEARVAALDAPGTDADFRGLMLHMVDLSDLFPPGAELGPFVTTYIQTRTDLVNRTIDQIIEDAGCTPPPRD